MNTYTHLDHEWRRDGAARYAELLLQSMPSNPLRLAGREKMQACAGVLAFDLTQCRICPSRPEASNRLRAEYARTAKHERDPVRALCLAYGEIVAEISHGGADQ